MPGQTISHYHKNAAFYQKQYTAIDAKEIHADWLPKLAQRTPGTALDVGAGSGRDAIWLASLGWQVTAVEPAQGLRELGQLATDRSVNWVDAYLPQLDNVQPPANGYALILLSAVWMHLPASERPAAFQRLTELLSDNGILIITLRFGPSDPSRPMYSVSSTELKSLAEQYGLQFHLLNENASSDRLQRADVSWQTVCIQHSPEPVA